jgi:Cd2+/Zn2+-exporting ATPase
LSHIEEKSSFVAFARKNIKLIMSFALFFTALLTSFAEMVDIGLYIVAYLLVSTRVLKAAVRGIAKGQMLDENFLMAIASIVAFLIGEYAEGVAVMLFYAVGQLTEEYAINRSKRSISSLLDLRPDYANLKTANGIKKVDPSVVSLGDIIVVKPGERIPVDGVVTKGRTQIDSAMLTGESLPVAVEVESEVYSGTINLDAVIEMKVTKIFADSAVSKILKMVQKANENKAETEKFITKFAKVYTPLVVVAAGLIAIIPTLFFGQSFDTWIYRGAIFLVVSCPCALVISVPLGYFGGIGGAAKNGLLVKGGQFLEVLKKPGVIVFDKTGTLTKGNFKVASVDVVGNLSEDEILRYSAHIESMSNHPIAKAIVSAYKGEVIESEVHHVQEVAGRGLKGDYNNQSVMIGNDALMKEQSVVLPDHNAVGTTLYLAVEGNLQGILHINDEIKEKTSEGLKRLKDLGIKKFIMLTGDRKPIADAIGQELGMDEIHSELMPGDKLDILENILKTEENVIFVGDGINDAPVLSRADVGIAMGNLGSDVAIESSDVVLMNDEITTIADGVQVSRFTASIIIQNIVFALGIKVLIMLLGTLGYASLWMAIFGDVGVAFIAILNSGRAIYKK